MVRGARAQMFVDGGAAIALAYDGDRTTADVDAVFAPTDVVRGVVADLGRRHGLQDDWIDDAAKGFLPGQDPDPVAVYESDALVVQFASAEYLLVMKLLAAPRRQDPPAPPHLGPGTSVEGPGL